MNRRSFLIHSLSTMAAFKLLHANAFTSPSVNNIFLIGDGIKPSKNLFNANLGHSDNGSIKVYKSLTHSWQSLPLPFLPHSFTFHPSRPHRIFTFEKWGHYLAEIDIVNNKVIMISEISSEHRFFGHGTFTDTTPYLFASLMDDKKGLGYLAIINPNNHKIIDYIPSEGAYPHDCQWDSFSKSVVVINSRKKTALNKDQQIKTRNAEDDASSLVWINPITRKIEKQINLQNTVGGYAHFHIISHEYIVISGSYNSKSGQSFPLLAVITNNSISNLSTNSFKKGEALSLAVDIFNKKIAVSFPQSNAVGIWSFDKPNPIGHYKIYEPRGLIFSEKENIFIATSAGNKSFYSKINFKNEFQTLLKDGGIGSHLGHLILK